MTVRELKAMLKGLPNNMEVDIQVAGELIPLCGLSDVEVVSIVTDEILEEANFDFEAIDLEKCDYKEVLVLKHCTCSEDELELEKGEINSQPELN